MTYAPDLTGQKFGRLTVLNRNYEQQNKILEEKGRHVAFWDCVCECGNRTIVTSSNLKNKNTFSCGCLRNEKIRVQKNTKEITWIEKYDSYTGVTIAGDTFTIDKEDYEKAKDYCWRKSNKGYIIANSRTGENKIIWLHRLVMDIDDPNILIDHKNWDKTNCKKTNLRYCNKTQNNINIKRKENNTTGYTGVTQNKRTGNYIARISYGGIRYYLGTYANFEDAVVARRKAEKIVHKEWDGEINRKDFLKIIKDTSDAPDMEEAEEVLMEE